MLSKEYSKISLRLIAGFVIIILLTVVIGASSLYQLTKVSNTVIDIYEHPLNVSNAIRDINSEILYIQSSLRDILLSQDESQIDILYLDINARQDRIGELFDLVYDRFLGDKSDVIDARNSFEKWQPVIDDFVELKKEGESNQATRVLNEENNSCVELINSKMSIMSKFAAYKAKAFYADSRQTLTNTIILTSLFLIIAAASAVIISIMITRSITRPLSLVIDGIRKISGGDLDHKIDIDKKDEISYLAREINDMIERLKHTTTSRDELFDINKKLAEEVKHHQETSEQLEEEKENARITLNSIGDGVIATDTHGRITRLNAVSEKLTGWKESDALGKDLKEVFKIVNSYTRQEVDNPVARVLETGWIVGLANHTVLISKDGSEYQIADSAAPIKDSFDSIMGVVLVFRDVTDEYKQQEQLLEQTERNRLAIDAGSMGTWDWDIETGMVTVDKRWRALFGFEDSEEVIAADRIFAKVHPDDLETLERDAQRCISGQTDDYISVFRIEKEPDEWVWIKAVGRVMEQPSGTKPTRMLGVSYDVTESRNLQIELASEKEHFKTILESIGDAVIATDVNGKITNINLVAENLTGWNVDNALGQPLEKVFKAIETDSEEVIEDPVSSVISTGTPIVLSKDTTLIRRDGKRYQISDSISPIRDSQGEVRGVVLVFRDVTQEYHRRVRLLEETEYRKLAVEAACVGLWQWNINTGMFTVDDNWIKMFSWKNGKTFYVDKVIDNIHKDNLAEVRRNIEDCLCGKIDNYDVTFRYKVGSGKWIWVRSLGKVIGRDSSGRPHKFMGANTDITEMKNKELQLRDSEQRLKAMFDNATMMIALVDSDLKPMYINPYCEKLGYSIKELRQNSIIEFTHVDDRESSIENYRKIFAGEVQSFVEDKRYICQDGRIIEVELMAVPITGYDGKIKYVLAMASDITERNRMLKALKRSNEDLEQFAYIASHDLREPLRTIGLYVELLEREYGSLFDKEAVGYMHLIIQSVRRMYDLIQGLLDYSRVGNNLVRMDSVDMNHVFKTVSANLERSISEANVQINAGDLDEVRGSELLIVQLMQNLISNAIKFRSKDRTSQIDISSIREDHNVHFMIKDNGIGIKSEFHDKIFDIFKRLNSRQEYDGTGIGLSVAKRIVDRHNGSIWVESEDGEGTTFHFTLPGA